MCEAIGASVEMERTVCTNFQNERPSQLRSCSLANFPPSSRKCRTSMPAPPKLLVVFLATALFLVASSAVTTAQQMNTTTVSMDQCILCKSGDCAKSSIKYCSDYSFAGGMSRPCCCAKSEICGTGPVWCNCAPGLPEKNQYTWMFFAISAVVIVALLTFAVYANVMKHRSQLSVLHKPGGKWLVGNARRLSFTIDLIVDAKEDTLYI